MCVKLALEVGVDLTYHVSRTLPGGFHGRHQHISAPHPDHSSYLGGTSSLACRPLAIQPPPRHHTICRGVQIHEETDLFLRHESIFEAHYQSHYATSGQTYQHYRLAYKYGFDLAQDRDNQKMDWKRLEPLARQNWNEGIMGSWSQHQEAILYGWEQGIKNHGG